MMKTALIKPNLPASNAVLCAVGKTYGAIAEAVQKKGIDVALLDVDERLPKPVQAHADMLICHTGGPRVICSTADNAALLRLHDFKAEIGEAIYQSTYPMDVHLNQLIVGDICMGLRSAVDSVVLRDLKGQGIHYIDIKQGYAKCSAAVVADRAIITDDYATAKAAHHLDWAILLVRKGHINLPGYNYGFIGGTCGLIAPDHMVFAGRIEGHPDFDAIAAFLKQHHVSWESLGNEQLYDIGGIIPLAER